ncbi:MAG TPA: Spy/CpxP family protein refolding chaperone [Rhizomicrobium sp.]|nr:Spy/CpxP family protein refolding chaperone [Rhizomicrobium sp.]
MRKALLPMVASLALCGAATAALVATNARAEQSARRPTMIALVTANSDGTLATPRAEGSPPSGMRSEMRDEMMQPRREQICKNLYARKAGELAFLEAKLSLKANQAPLFARWKQASLDVAKQHETDCATYRPEARGRRLTVVDRLTLEEDLLKKRLADIQTERPALTALYGTLSVAQKEEFSQGDMRRMAGRLHMMLGMMDRPHPGMGPGQMGRGPMDEPPEPPPPAR